MGPSGDKPRLNIHVRRNSTYQGLKMLAVLESGEGDKNVTVTDLANEALEMFVRARIDLRVKGGKDPEEAWSFLDKVDFVVPGDPEYPDEETIDRISEELNRDE